MCVDNLSFAFSYHYYVLDFQSAVLYFISSFVHRILTLIERAGVDPHFGNQLIGKMYRKVRA
eukprot:SAG11_NODE_96_length_17016_cov_18.755113_7_plen_62_part_00